MSKILTGVVVSNKMTKTIVVDVARKFQHPRFRKIINIHKKFKVHVEEGTVEVGTVVRIQETKPISKDKHFILLSTEGVVKAKPEAEQVIKKATKAQKEEKTAEKVEVPTIIESPKNKVAKKAATKTTKKTAVKTAKKKVTNSKE